MKRRIKTKWKYRICRYCEKLKLFKNKLSLDGLCSKKCLLAETKEDSKFKWKRQDLNRPTLQNSINKILERHKMLRSLEIRGNKEKCL